ncbi:MAG: peptide ABC transporter substrate-binding protein [Candidatus Aenigmarchaeota archaeon]|nr:peptide ABC transporter substrate-binding protein [Candidatus Aenigmarchaeota archaeon]
MSLVIIWKKIKNWLNNLFAPKNQDTLDQQLVINLAPKKHPSMKQIKYLPKLLTWREKKIIKVLAGIIIISLLLLGINFYFNHTASVPASGGEYSEGLIGLPQFVNPVLSSINAVDADLSRLIFSGLLKYQDGRLIPDLCQQYEISDDKKTYTFHLRQNTFWHDGEPISANDIVFTVKTIKDPQIRSPLQASWQKIDVKQLDDYTVQFALSEPFAPFLSLLTFGILPEHIWKNIPSLQFYLTDFNSRPIGSGPWKFKSLTKNVLGLIKSYTLERNKQYYQQPPYLKELTFYFYPDFEQASSDLKANYLDALAFLPSYLNSELENIKYLRSYPTQLPHYVGLFFNQANNALLNIKEIRQALSYGVDKQQIVSQTLNNQAKIINSFNLGLSEDKLTNEKKYTFNSQLAGDLLDQANFKIDQETGYRKKDDQIIELTITTIDQAENQQIAEIIQENWQQLGIDVKIELIPKENIQKEIIRPRKYQILLYGIITANDDLYSFWHSSQRQDPGLNLTCFNNREADQLLEEGRKITNEQIKAEKYSALANILANEVPAIFLYQPEHQYLINKKIKGIDINQLSIPSDRFNNSADWYSSTKRQIK